MNGKNGFTAKRSKKTDSPQEKKLNNFSNKISKKKSTNRTTNEKNSGEKKLKEQRNNLMPNFSDCKKDQKPDKIQFSTKDDKKGFNLSDEEENAYDDKQFSKLDQILFDEQISDDDEEFSTLDKILFDDMSDGENKGQTSNKEQREKLLFSSDDDEALVFLSEEEKSKKINKKQKKGHSSTEKVTFSNRKKRSHSMKMSKDSENLSEYEYSYYSEEHIEKSKLTFEDLIKLAANKHFERKEFQKIADEEINSRSFTSLESIDYENDEDWFIKTKTKLKHRRKIDKKQNRALKEKNINKIDSYQKTPQIKNFPRKNLLYF